jgi:hypothetical protein
LSYIIKSSVGDVWLHLKMNTLHIQDEFDLVTYKILRYEINYPQKLWISRVLTNLEVTVGLGLRLSGYFLLRRFLFKALTRLYDFGFNNLCGVGLRHNCLGCILL